MNDETTAALMAAFYAHLKDGMGKAQTLTATQTDLRNDATHPK